MFRRKPWGGGGARNLKISTFFIFATGGAQNILIFVFPNDKAETFLSERATQL